MSAAEMFHVLADIKTVVLFKPPAKLHERWGNGEAVQRIAVYEPFVGTQEAHNVAQALADNALIHGAFSTRFEAQIAEFTGTRFAVGTNSGTAAIHTALMLAGIKRGDEVLITTMTFIAPANAIAYIGAHPVFVDVQQTDWQIDPAILQRFCEEDCDFDGKRLVNRATGRPVTAILVVHFLGMAADLDAIMAIAQRYHLSVVEDAAQSLGTKYRGRSVGSMGRAGCFSFYGNKLITAAGGGMIVTDDEALARRARYLVNQAKDNAVETVHRSIGYNYRMTNIHGAIGCAQFDRIGHHIARKREIASRYREALAGLPGITMPTEPADQFHTFWLSSIRIDPVLFGMDARALLRRLGDENIEAITLYQPLHLSEAHAGAQAPGGAVAEALVRGTLSIPSSVGLTDEDQGRVIAAIVSASMARSQ